MSANGGLTGGGGAEQLHEADADARVVLRGCGAKAPPGSTQAPRARVSQADRRAAGQAALDEGALENPSSSNPEESVAFFYDLLGMEASHREAQSVYLRAYEDFYQYTLRITEAAHPGLEEVTGRASSPEALERQVKAIEAAGSRLDRSGLHAGPGV